MSLPGVVALGCALVVVAVVALVLRSRDGRVRAARTATGGWGLAEHAPAAGERVLLLQLSSPVCTPCRQTAGVLRELVARRPEIVHTEIDVADRPDVAAALHVMRTPTVVAFGPDGGELLRVSGVPRTAELESALAAELAG